PPLPLHHLLTPLPPPTPTHPPPPPAPHPIQQHPATTLPRRPHHHDKPRHQRLVESHHQRTNRLGTTPTHRLPHPLCPLELHQHQPGLHLLSPTKHHPALPTQQRQQHPAPTLPRRPRHHDKPRH